VCSSDLIWGFMPESQEIGELLAADLPSPAVRLGDHVDWESETPAEPRSLQKVLKRQQCLHDYQVTCLHPCATTASHLNVHADKPAQHRNGIKLPGDLDS